jgi:glutaredoxin
MEYHLFTYPNCSKCVAIKEYLEKAHLDGREHSLILKDSKSKIREFLGVIKRDEKGSIIIPTLVIQDGQKVLVVLNNRQELEEWLKSRE